MKVQVRENIALVDQIVLSNIEIVHMINIEELIKKNIVELSTNPQTYIMADGHEFSKLTIEKDGVIDHMVAGAIIRSNQLIKYCTLSLSVHRDTGNICCNTIEDYQKILVQVQEHLLCNYGIEISIKNATIKEIEINKTFALAHSYEDYRRVIQVIMHNLPKELSVQMHCSENGKEKIKPGTFYATSSKTGKSDRYTTVKIYDKTSALSAKLNIVLDTSYMRVELRLIGTQRVKRALTTNKLYMITDNMINTCYQRHMQRYIYNRHDKWLKKRDKKLLNLIKQQQDMDIRHWQVNLLRYLANDEIANAYPTLLDVHELFPLLEKLSLTSKRRYEIRTNFKRHAEKYETVFNQRDDLKLTEILEKLGKPTS